MVILHCFSGFVCALIDYDAHQMFEIYGLYYILNNNARKACIVYNKVQTHIAGIDLYYLFSSIHLSNVHDMFTQVSGCYS